MSKTHVVFGRDRLIGIEFVGVDGLTTLEMLQRENGPMPVTRVALSEDSRLYLFIWPEGLPLPTDGEAVGPGAYFRTAGSIDVDPAQDPD